MTNTCRQRSSRLRHHGGGWGPQHLPRLRRTIIANTGPNLNFAEQGHQPTCMLSSLAASLMLHRQMPFTRRRNFSSLQFTPHA